MHTYKHNYIHTHTRTHTNKSTRDLYEDLAALHLISRVSVCAYVCVCTITMCGATYMHTCIHTCMHTYIPTHTVCSKTERVRVASMKALSHFASQAAIRTKIIQVIYPAYVWIVYTVYSTHFSICSIFFLSGFKYLTVCVPRTRTSPRWSVHCGARTRTTHSALTWAWSLPIIEAETVQPPSTGRITTLLRRRVITLSLNTCKLW